MVLVVRDTVIIWHKFMIIYNYLKFNVSMLLSIEPYGVKTRI